LVVDGELLALDRLAKIVLKQLTLGCLAVHRRLIEAMLATAGNTTNDGFVGAIINDRLMDWTAVDGEPAVPAFVPDPVPYPRAVRAAAAVLLGPAIWMIVAPQARIGLSALQWMSRSTFRGEALVGAAILLVALTGLLGGRRERPQGEPRRP